MRITNGQVIVCSPGRNFVTLKLTTSDGIYGLGDATLNGRELAEKLQGEKGALKVIYTSGYSMELLGSGLTTSRNFVFLQKPYHPDALASVVRNCLDGKLV